MSDRTTYRVVGVLFVMATVGSVLASAIQGSVLDGAGYLAGVADDGGRVIGAAIVFLIAAVSAVGTALLLFPMLRRHTEGLAISYVGMRVFENLLYVGGIAMTLAMLTVGQGDGIDADPAAAIIAGETLAALQHWFISIGTLIFFGIGAWVLNWILFRFALVPRWLSAWGLAGAVLVTAYGLLGLLGGDVGMGSPWMLLAMPIAAQEMVFAGWLIMRGLAERPVVDVAVPDYVSV